MSFAQDLKKWRGNVLQKNACDVFGISLNAFEAWEQGVNEPHELRRKAVDEIMLTPAWKHVQKTSSSKQKVTPAPFYNPQPKAPSRRDRHRMQVAAAIQIRK